ncbi:nucleotidyl transferase AbiEii/AbiGii toxin family protein [Rathayibacter sp. Leaf248]|uniref:nucleotidyl transferase AbiEii/AbiGii toxin family protein n=1 Tax=Rathayibacter sp. Leaf248 TaxID=2876555 RepID=UPI001E58F3ED|nr:nucleotidyl transferase AbiEii/AbiGii toxin family protein [Rathayibacter sp. Leaf248]
MDWRDTEPVRLQVGPVLSLDDAIGNKVSALYSRAEARDFLDVDSIRASGHFTDQRLLVAARERDPGFDAAMFAQQLDRAVRLTPDRVAEYGVNETELEGIQARFQQWAARIRRDLHFDQTDSPEHRRGLTF